MLEREVAARAPANRLAAPRLVLEKAPRTMLRCIQVLGWLLAQLPATRRLRGHRSFLNTVIELPDGRLASGSDDHTVILWELDGAASGWTSSSVGGRRSKLLDGSSLYVNDLALLADGRLVQGSEIPAVLVIWDTSTGQKLRTIGGHRHWIWAVVVLGDGVTVASGSDDKTVKLWDTRREQAPMLAELRCDEKVRALAVLEDGHTLAIGSDDGVVRLWDTRADPGSAIELRRSGQAAHSSYVIALAVLGGRLASSGGDRRVLLWDSSTLELVGTIEDGGKFGGLARGLAVLGDGRTIAVCAGRSILLWDSCTLCMLRELRGHSGRVRALTVLGLVTAALTHWCQVLRDGVTLVSGSEDETIVTWDLTHL